MPEIASEPVQTRQQKIENAQKAIRRIQEQRATTKPNEDTRARNAIRKPAEPLSPATQRAEDLSRQEPGFLAAQREPEPTTDTAIIKADQVRTESQPTETEEQAQPQATEEGQVPTETTETQPSPEVTDNPEAEMPQHSPKFLYLVNAGKFEDGPFEQTPLNDKPERAYQVVGKKSMDIRRKIQQEKYGHLTFEENQERWAQTWVGKFTELAKAPNSGLFFKTLGEKVGFQIDTTKLLDPTTQAQEAEKIKAHLKGSFFEEYCQQDGLGKLADNLSVQDTVVLKTFVRGMFGGGNQLLYDSFVATVAAKGNSAKDIITQEAVEQSQLSDHEKEILAFLNEESVEETTETPLAAAEVLTAEPNAVSPPSEEDDKEGTQFYVPPVEDGGFSVIENISDERKAQLEELKKQLAGKDPSEVPTLDEGIARVAEETQELRKQHPNSEVPLSDYYLSCNDFMKHLGIKGDAQKMIEGKNPKDIADLQAKLGAYYRELGLFRSAKNGDSITTFFNSSTTNLSHLTPEQRAKLLFAALQGRETIKYPTVQARMNKLRESLESVGFYFLPTIHNKNNEVIHQDALVDGLDKKLHTYGQVDVTMSLYEIIHAADTFELTPTVKKMMRENGRSQQLDQYEDATTHEEPLAA